MPRVALASRDAALAGRLSAALDRDGALERLDPDRPLAAQLAGEPPALLLVDIGAEGADAALVRQAVDAAFGLVGRPEVVTLGRAADAAQVLAAMRSGSVDFVDRAEPAKALRDHIGPRLRQATAQTRGEHGLTVVVAADGGVGATLFGVNLALVRAAEAGEALLIDCALPATQADAALNLSPAYAFPDAVRDRDRLDRTLLTASVASHPAGVSLLPLATRASDAAVISPDSFLRTLRTLRPLFAETVLLLGAMRHPGVLRAAVETASAIYLLCPQAFTAVREAKDLLAAMELGPDLAQRVTLVVEDYSPAVTLSDEQMQGALGLRHTFRLPRARDDLLNSLNLGQPLVVERPQGAYAEALRRLTGRQEAEARAPSGLASARAGVRNWLGGMGARR